MVYCLTTDNGTNIDNYLIISTNEVAFLRPALYRHFGLAFTENEICFSFYSLSDSSSRQCSGLLRMSEHLIFPLPISNPFLLIG